MADLNTLAQRSAMLNGTTPYMQTGSSRYDEGMKKQHFAAQTRAYAQKIGAAASNVYDAMCQGVSGGDGWYAWRKVRIRVSPAASSATGETMPDDWQKLHIIKPTSIDTIPAGAYLTFAGSTWIVYKGKNMGSVLGDCIIRRCNSVINVLDWYGNIVAVPMSYAKMGTLGNASHATENSIVAKNYISCVCQLNPYSAAFAENTRIVLGKTAYSIRGLNDFTREFTDDPDSVHLLSYTIERGGLLPQDSVEKQCADYHSFRWELAVDAPKVLPAGGSAQINVASIRMGETVVSTEENPIGYTFTSSNARVSVSDSGVISALPLVSAGATATITVSLAQNPEITQSFKVKVNQSSGTRIEFTSNVPERLRAYESIVIRASLFSGNEEFPDELTLTCSGPPTSLYAVENVERNAWKITAYGASNTPLTVKVSTTRNDIEFSNSAEIMLTT